MIFLAHPRRALPGVSVLRVRRLTATAALLLLASPGAGADTLLVVRKTDGALDFVDPGSATRLVSVAVGHAPHEVSVSPDGTRAVVSNYGTREQPGHSISIVNTVEPGEIRRIDLGRHTRPHGVAWFAPDRIAVTTEGSGHLLVVDPVDGRLVTEVGTGQQVSHMVAVSRDGTRAYVANIGSGTTTAIDLVAGRKLGDVATGNGTEALALTPDGGALWVGAREAGEVAVVDTASLQVVSRIAVPGIPIRLAITPDGATALATCAGSGEVVVLDVRERRETARRRLDFAPAPSAAARPMARLAPGSPLPVGLALAGDGRTAYVAATMADQVVVTEIAGLATVRSVAVGGEPDGLALTPVLPRARCHACTADP
jgi:YVTN family beta-propeller protein